MTSPKPLDSAVLKRLTFIRLLHQQGVDQSRLPEPLSFTSILSFHDAVEHFLVLAGEHLGANLPKRMDFLQYWSELNKDTQPRPVLLSGRTAMDRLNRIRVNFKHVGAPPSPQSVEDARSDVRNFFEDNSPKVFGVEFDQVDMADLLAEDETRSLVKQASAAEDAKDRTAAMSLLVDAFNRQFSQHVDRRSYPTSPFSIGPEITFPLREFDIRRAIQDHSIGSSGPLAKQIAQLTEIATASQNALRILTLGVEYHAYLRFRQLTPHVTYTMDGTRHVNTYDGYAPSAEDFEYCRQFVVTAALRLAEIKAQIAPPAWMPGDTF